MQITPAASQGADRDTWRGVTAITAWPNFQLRKDLILRPELRYNCNEESRPFQGHHGVFTATTDVIVRW